MVFFCEYKSYMDFYPDWMTYECHIFSFILSEQVVNHRLHNQLGYSHEFVRLTKKRHKF